MARQPVSHKNNSQKRFDAPAELGGQPSRKQMSYSDKPGEPDNLEIRPCCEELGRCCRKCCSSVCAKPNKD